MKSDSEKNADVNLLPDRKASGMLLLKKGKKGIFRMIFSRTGVVLFLLFLNILLLFAIFGWFEDFLPLFYGANIIFVVSMVIYLINSRIDATAKITWLVVIMLLPVFGSLLYLYTRTELGHLAMKKRLQKIYTESKNRLKSEQGSALLLEQDSCAAAMTRYVSSFTGIPVFQNTEVFYFSDGRKMFERLLTELDKAKTSIYLEYFIIQEGKMWGEILEILAEKAAQGVDVRVVYDGTCEFMLLPKSYPQKLKKLGIQCQVFAPVTPFLSTHYNYRDHRKILTIDGKIAFTGGINLADEYINEKKLFGYWKDTAVMLKGEAAKGFEYMFLQMWNLKGKKITFPESDRGVSEKIDNTGFVMPYFDDPLDEEHIGKQVYIDILNRSKRCVYITTPYLILDGELESAICYAAKRGVNVNLLLPGIPDKKIPYALAKSHYQSLIEAGVKIYEYTPGFLHAKMMVSDDLEAVVGTINLDYRSLHHHFECAVYLYGLQCIDEIVDDIQKCMEQSKSVTKQSIRSEKLFYKLIGPILKVVAPLL